jgi:ABC-type transport system involved in cytochrome c biogenesis permease component
VSRFWVILQKDLKASWSEGLFLLIILWAPVASAITRWLVGVLGGDMATLGPRMVPMWLSMNTIVMGVMLLAMLFIMEKEHGTMAALRLTPLTLAELVSAKLTISLFISVASAISLVLLNVGAVNIPELTVISLAGMLFALAVGLLAAQFATNMMQFMVSVRLLMLPLMVPAILHFFPHVQADWLKVIPTYFLIRASSQVVVHGASLSDVAGDIGMMLLQGTVLLFVTIVIIAKRDRRPS